MKTHNLIIYHCLGCGAVLHCEPELEIPQCCGRQMIKAAAETVINAANGTAPVRADVAAAVPAEPAELHKRPR